MISLCTIDRFTGKLLRRKEVLEETCHLSYPFLMEKPVEFIQNHLEMVFGRVFILMVKKFPTNE